MPDEQKSFPWEIDAFDAKEAIHRGGDVVLAIYLRDAANAMRLLADLADPKGDGLPQLHCHSITSAPEQPGENLEDEYPAPGTARQLQQAAQYGQGRQVGRYLRELGELLNLMAGALSTEKSPLEWKLRFKRARAGRPIDRQKQLEAVRDIKTRLRFAKAEGVNQKRLIWELQREYGLSRAAIYRINRPKPSQSHKKR